MNLERRDDDDPDYAGPDMGLYIGVYRCPSCHEASIWRYAWSDDMGEAWAERRVYPTSRDNSSLPQRVRTRLDAAQRVRKIEPGLYAVAIRRMLETVCKDKGATGDDLFEQLDDLKTRELIPEPLTDVAHQLRKLGNFGAHDDDVEVDERDVPVIEDLADALLEYLYRGPAKVAAVKEAIKTRKKLAKKSPEAKS